MALLVSGCVSRSSTLPRPSRRVASRRVASHRVAQDPSKNGTYYANRQRKRNTDKERVTRGGAVVAGREMGAREEFNHRPVIFCCSGGSGGGTGR